jgi:mannose-6-phosphate isomerase-like protein (cupin superfamily)
MKNDHLSELLAGYALDALAAEERRGVEQLLDGAPELEAELAEFQRAIAAIPYTVPLVPLASNLKDRLMRRIATSESSSAIDVLKQKAETVNWEPYEPNSGAMLGKLLVDLDKREVQCFIRTVGTTKFPKHRHAHEEELVVLEGDLTIDGQSYQAGDRIYSTSGTTHQPETQSGCLLFLRTSLDDEILSSEATN